MTCCKVYCLREDIIGYDLSKFTFLEGTLFEISIFLRRVYDNEFMLSTLRLVNT